MQAGAICFREIEAFSRLLREEMQPWEVRALRRLDIAVRASAKTPAGKSKKGEPAEPDALVSVKDGAGVAGLMKGLGAKSVKAR
ncbi:hypothetical protein P9A16_34405 [Shinella sp. 838]|nr:hypothetical protein [Shinella sp. 838]MDG4676178.1 hypothetical protein [Shinella sp. 838]